MSEQTWKWKHFDRRTVDRYVEKGIITKAQFESYLKQLPDEAPNADWVELEMEETEIGEPITDDEPLHAPVNEDEADIDDLDDVEEDSTEKPA